MSKDIHKILLDPTRIRIVQAFILGKKQAFTTSEICDLLSDVPRATLYRHINVLIEANILHIVSERKVRGSWERTLSIHMDTVKAASETEDVPQRIFQVLMLIYAKFERYFQNKPDKSRASVTDTMFISQTTLVLTDEEFATFLTEMQALTEKYLFDDVVKGRRLRDISFICAPPEVEKDQSGGSCE